MNYKKNLILLLLIANIMFVLALLFNRTIKEKFQETRPVCCPQDTGCPTEPGVTTSSISDAPGGSITCERFLVFFIVNDPVNCSNDDRINTIYDTYLSNRRDLRSSHKIYHAKFTIDHLTSLEIDNIGIETLFTDEVNTIVNASPTQSPFILYKNVNSVQIELHKNSENRINFEVGSGNNRLDFYDINSEEKADEFLISLKNNYIDSVPDPETCELPTTTADTTPTAATTPTAVTTPTTTS